MARLGSDQMTQSMERYRRGKVYRARSGSAITCHVDDYANRAHLPRAAQNLTQTPTSSDRRSLRPVRDFARKECPFGAVRLT